jgi:hypothetical protein
MSGLNVLLNVRFLLETACFMFKFGVGRPSFFISILSVEDRLQNGSAIKLCTEFMFLLIKTIAVNIPLQFACNLLGPYGMDLNAEEKAR